MAYEKVNDKIVGFTLLPLKFQMSTNNFFDTQRIFRDTTIHLREETNGLVLGPEWGTIIGKFILPLIIAFFILDSVAFVSCYVLHAYYGYSFFLFFVAAGGMGSLLLLGIAASVVKAKTLVQRKTRLTVSPTQVTVKDARFQDVNLATDPQMTFNCDATYDADGRELFDVSLRYRGDVYYLLSGYAAEEMNTLCSLLNDYFSKNVRTS